MTIAAARALGFKRIVAAFQPHRYTRTQALREQFATAFRDADKLFLTDIYAASEKPIEGITGKTLVESVTAAGQRDVVYEPNCEQLTEQLLTEAVPGTLIMTLGAGDIYKTAEAVAAKLFVRGPSILPAERQLRNLEADLRACLSDKGKLRRNEPMTRHTSLKVGGPAQFWLEPGNEHDLVRALQYCHGRQVPVTLVGRGTNLLVRDGGIQGVVIHLGSSEFSRIEVDGDRLIARAGARLKTVVLTAERHEIGGLEFLECIPGSLGGALRMNAGAMGRQMFDVVEWVRYISFSGETYVTEGKFLPVSYRNCPIFANHIALSAILRGVRASRGEIGKRLRAFGKRRWATQPAKPSAGCIFKNPETIPAGKLIEELGLKGAAVGGARVSELHGNFIVNEGRATAADVLGLIALIRERARHERGIELEPEVMVLGTDKTEGAQR